MSVLDRLPEHALSAELRRRAAERSEYKGSFQALGSRSVQSRRVFSSAAYDIQFTASTTPNQIIYHRADIEFLPGDDTFGGALCHRVMIKYLDLSNNVATWLNPQIERVRTTDGRQMWRVYHTTYGYSSDSVRLKFYFFTTGSGTFTANVIT